MPSVIQLHMSLAESRSQSDEQVVKERPNGGMPSPKADIRDHEDYEAMTEQVSVENDCVDLGFDEVYAHDLGRDQEEFVGAYGECVIPKLHWTEMG
jgi:coenzyme F420-dependent glucose-6-phosphate dehydrogenase